MKFSNLWWRWRNEYDPKVVSELIRQTNEQEYISDNVKKIAENIDNFIRVERSEDQTDPKYKYHKIYVTLYDDGSKVLVEKRDKVDGNERIFFDLSLAENDFLADVFNQRWHREWQHRHHFKKNPISNFDLGF